MRQGRYALTRPYAILISDHEEEVGRRLARAFASSPYDTMVAYRGWDVIEILERRPVDVLVLDIQMPDLGGISLVRILKEMELAPPCVFTSYSFSKELLIEAMIADVYSVLEKPIDLRLLRAVVEDVLRKSYPSSR